VSRSFAILLRANLSAPTSDDEAQPCPSPLTSIITSCRISSFARQTTRANPVGGIAPPPWNTDLMLSFMDEAGIDVAITSISTPGVHVGNDARARSLAHRCNELSAELIQAHPKRLGGFAALPLPDVDGALEELAYAFDTLKLDGVVLFSNSNGVYLGDARFEPFFAEWSGARQWCSSTRRPRRILRPTTLACRIP